MPTLKISASPIRATKELNTINAGVHCAVPLESQYTSFPVGALQERTAATEEAGDGYSWKELDLRQATVMYKPDSVVRFQCALINGQKNALIFVVDVAQTLLATP